MAVGELDGRAIAFVAGERTLRVLDLRTGHLQESLADDTFGVQAVAVGKLNGHPIAVAGDWGGRLRVWDLRTGRAQGKPMSVGRLRTMLTTGRPTAIAAAIRAVAIGQIDGLHIAVTVPAIDECTCGTYVPTTRTGLH